MRNEIAELEYVISVLDTLYEQGEECVHPITGQVVSNPEYDAMRGRLAHLDPKNALFDGVTASAVKTPVKKVKHNPPMTSIHKAIGTLAERQKELARWQQNVVTELGYADGTWACQAYKLDGVACALYYSKGKLISAGLRPHDGVAGEDITKNVAFVEGVVQTLPVPLTGTIRGEIICKKSAFAAILADWQNPKYDLSSIPKNPRAHAAGSIRQFKNPEITKERRLSFIAYAIISDDVTERDEIALAKWSNQKLGVTYVRTTPFGKGWTLKDFEDNVNTLDYEVDGVVLSVRNIDDREQMGHHGDSPINPPKGRLAWKFEEEHVDVTVKNILWETGRTGGIVPVLQFDGVQLDGTTVCQCTGHNLGFLQRNKIGVGTLVRVIKSGKIIPKVIGVISNCVAPGHPTKCPACGQTAFAVYNGGMCELMCLNVTCVARAVSTITHYLSTLGVKGVAESTVQKLYDASLVKSPADLYDLRPGQLEFLGKRNAQLAVARIHMVDQAEKLGDDELRAAVADAIKAKKKVQLWQFFASLGIDGSGRTAGKALAAHFSGNFKSIREAGLQELTGVDGIGEKSAGVIVDFFAGNVELVDKLLEHIELDMPKVGKLTGKVFCLTGGFPGGKTAIEKKIEDAGGKTTSSVSKKVNYVVVGADAGSKERKADELGIEKITLAKLEGMF